MSDLPPCNSDVPKSFALRPTVLHVTFWADIRYPHGSVQKLMLAFAGYGKDWHHRIASIGKPGEPDFKLNGVECSAFYESRWRNRVFNKWLRLKRFTYPSLLQVIERIRPDIIHFHNRPEIVDVIVERLSYRPKIVAQYHRQFSAMTLPKSADRLICPSRALAQTLESSGALSEIVRIVPNPLSSELISIGNEHTGRAFTPDDVLTFIYGGGYNRDKGLFELLEAFQSLTGNYSLLLAGSGYDQLAPIPDTRIKIIGELTGPNFLREIHNSDIVVMPSYHESFGLVALEAMYLKRILVVSRVGGLAEITNENCAIQVAPRSVAKLHNGLLRAAEIAGNEANRWKMISEAYNHALTFHPEKCTATLERIYTELHKFKK